MGKRTIIIDLDNSLYAHEFVNEQQIHQEDLDKAIGIIRNHIKRCETSKSIDDVFLSHIYRTIGVFGDRGSGKTSFMISLLNRCKTEMEEVEVLKMIDPTLVEHKKPIVLCVISMIQQKVEFKLKSRNVKLQVMLTKKERTGTILWQKSPKVFLPLTT